ncbi:hypothetical protein EJ08DRAFT_676492 [Tothia fuscella]|uniref:Uncharacterized protein n=1 Tax=Tothia fuscella TaxID=1048955 RepID=A0A9P4NYX9_9PEZI|nr:hypothetical protein EJ08DRAFT_676492 [Tothia fuscella]
MVNWKSLESYERLLAAIVAANGGKVDFKLVAHYYGEGATYDAIEGRFRKAKKDAAALAEEAKDRPVPKSRSDKPASTVSPPRKKAANGNGVKSGRVTKSTPRKGAKGKFQHGSDEEDDSEGGGSSVKSPIKKEPSPTSEVEA